MAVVAVERLKGLQRGLKRLAQEAASCALIVEFSKAPQGEADVRVMAGSR